MVLQEEVDRFAESEGTKAIFHLSGEKRELPSTVQASLLRICQEALHNIRKYAQATKVTVSLEFFKGHATMSVQDNGVGFDVASLQAPDIHFRPPVRRRPGGKRQEFVDGLPALARRSQRSGAGQAARRRRNDRERDVALHLDVVPAADHQ